MALGRMATSPTPDHTAVDQTVIFPPFNRSQTVDVHLLDPTARSTRSSSVATSARRPVPRSPALQDAPTLVPRRATVDARTSWPGGATRSARPMVGLAQRRRQDVELHPV